MKNMEYYGKEFRIGELSKLTGVKAGTIRFYERCGFLSAAKRLENRYRVFDERHIYQVRICRLVFGGFVNKRLRKNSMELIWAAVKWDLETYQKAAENYLRVVQEEIEETKKTVAAVFERLNIQNAGEGAGACGSNGGAEEEFHAGEGFDAGRMDGGAGEGFHAGRMDGGAEERFHAGRTDGGAGEGSSSCSAADKKEILTQNAGCSKKQAAALLRITPETIRNWERNGLLGQPLPYQKRFYSPQALERMYIIRLLLDNGYSMMAVRRFFAKLDLGDNEAAAKTLMSPKESETLIYRADRYMETLFHTQEKAKQLFGLTEEMRAVMKQTKELEKTGIT